MTRATAAAGSTPEAPDPLPRGPALSRADFDWFRDRLYRLAGISLHPLKQTMVAARLGKRLRQLGFEGYGDYRAHLEGCLVNDPEWREFINALTTNKTDFYREPQHFELLTGRLLAELRERASRRDGTLSIWSAGCSTGEEPYTLSMALREAWPGGRFRIVASDVDTAVLEAAGRGVYRTERLHGLAPAVRARHFLRAGRDLLQVHPEVRAAVQFQHVNLIAEPWPLGERFDAIFCRNVIIYFDRPTQTRLFERFARQLVPGGYLFIGHSESLLGLSELFERVEGTVYRLRGAPRPAPAPQPSWKRLIVGETFASAEPAWVSTVLGSCVSACLFDPQRRVGGMNHFLLPDGSGSSRYGAHAMEELLAELLRLGADRQHLAAKVFGAAHRAGSAEVSRRNREFVHQYLANQRIPVLAERLGGDRGMELRFETHTGRAMFRYLATDDVP